MAKQLIEALAGSKIYQDYESAFSEMTGLPVALRSVESWQLPHHDKKFENPFCEMLAGKSRSCAACLQTQQQLSETATHEAKTVTCPYFVLARPNLDVGIKAEDDYDKTID